MLSTLLLNIVYNTPQCWVYFIVSALNAYTSRSYCLCIVLFRKILAEGGDDVAIDERCFAGGRFDVVKPAPYHIIAYSQPSPFHFPTGASP